MSAAALATASCSCGAAAGLERLGERSITETVEEVVYVKQRIKHFNREGSEYWDEVSVPDLVEREVTRCCVEWVCRSGGKTRLEPLAAQPLEGG